MSLSNAINYQIYAGSNEISGRKNESVSEMMLQPFEKIEITVVFWPSSLERHEDASLVIFNQLLGTVTYILKGQGQSPPIMPITQPMCSVGASKTAIVNFENPFVDPALMNINFEQQGREFKLLTHPRTVSLAGMENFQIQVSYEPLAMVKARCEIQVKVLDFIWVFPIEVRSIQLIRVSQKCI